MRNVFILVFVISCVMCERGQVRNLKFPPGFLFGTASSAHQVEGAWNEDGKGESGLDNYFHHNRGLIIDNSTADVACDSYHLYKEDIPFVKMAGMDTYRFSLSWSRLLPTGDVNNINQIAVNYYNDLINEILRYNLTPVVTMNHFDLPLNFSKLGGWANRYVVDHFVAYAEFVLQTFGDRVKYWITINELNLMCSEGYGSISLDPGMNMQGIADYLCVHHSLLAHARAYRMYKRMPGHIKDGGKMGYTVAYNVIYPANETDIMDQVAAALLTELEYDWVLNPVFGSGDYPMTMRHIVDLRSLEEGRQVSRLPQFTPGETVLLKGSADFMAINSYTANFASFSNHCSDGESNRLNSDLDVYVCQNPKYATTTNNFMQVVPGSLHVTLTEVRKKYNNPLVFLTENGYPDSSHENLTNNPERENYFQTKISEVFQSIEEGSNVIGYLAWSLLDSFEFNNGYTLKFGMVHVDFEDEQKKRTAKPIIKFFHNVANYGLNVTST